MTEPITDVSARWELARGTALTAAGMRAAVSVVAAVTILLAPPAEPRVAFGAVAVNLALTLVFGYTAWRHPARIALVAAADVLLTIVFCLAQGHLAGAAALPGGASWIAGLATMSIVITNLVWTWPVAVPAGIAVAAAHLAGVRLAGVPDGGTLTAGIHLVQIGAVAGFMVVLRRAADAADRGLEEWRTVRQAEETRRALHEDERKQRDRLHGTVLATLTIVGLDGITERSATVRDRAGRDLRVLRSVVSELVAEPEPPVTPVDLRPLIQAVVRDCGLAVDDDLAEVRVNSDVADAFRAAATEALANVRRHAGTDRAEVALTEAAGVIRLLVRDKGTGFEDVMVPAHRYGIRESIIARMGRVDGDAEVRTSSAGTEVTLSWPRR